MHRLTRVWSTHPIYFITCCTVERRRVLATATASAILIEAWQAAPALSGWTVGRYVIMPDHVHFFASTHGGGKSLAGWLRDWKRWTARQFHLTAAIAPPLWQPEFFDHVLRSAGSYAEKWHYVAQNPVRAGLCAAPEKWAYAGECEAIAF